MVKTSEYTELSGAAKVSSLEIQTNAESSEECTELSPGNLWVMHTEWTGISQQPGRLKKEAWTQRSVSALEILQHSSRIILLSLSSCTSSGLTSLHSLHERTGSHFPRLLVTKPSEFWRSFIFTSKANNHSAVLLRFCYTYRWQGDFPEKEVLITKSYCCN